MRFVAIAVAAFALGVLELIVGWRIALAGVAPDALVILAAFAAVGLRPVERIPVACAIGLWSDYLLANRLGPMALGYGLGVWVADALMPAAASWQRGKLGVWPARAAHAMGMTLLVASTAHAAVALSAGVLGDTVRGAGDLALRSAGIALYTAAVCPLVWSLLAATIGPIAFDAWSSQPRVVRG
jgi:hypothetical protein